MSKFCELRGTTLYDLDLGYLTKMLGGSGAAIAALESNNGYNLDKAPNGQPSKLYLSLRLLVKEQHPDISDEDLNRETLRLKLKVYSPEFIEWFGDWTLPIKNRLKELTPIKDEFKGKLIFAQSGTGKSSIADNISVIDSDYILASILGTSVESAGIAFASLDFETKNKISELYHLKIKEEVNNGKTVLTTAPAMMKDADIIIINLSAELTDLRTSNPDRVGSNRFIDTKYLLNIIDLANALSPSKKVIKLDSSQYLSSILLEDLSFKINTSKKYITSLEAALNNFLKSFGISVNEIQDYDSKLPLFDALERVINVQDPSQITDAVGYAIAFMMQNTSEFKELVALMQMSPGSVGRAFRKHENPEFRISDRVFNQLDKQFYIQEIGKQIAIELRKFYNKEVITKDSTLLEKLWEFLNKFFDILTPSNKDRIRHLQAYTLNIAEAIVRGDMSFIRRANIKPGTSEIAEKVDIEKAFIEHPYEASFVKTLSKRQGITLAGSASIAIQANVLRPNENPLHDLDFGAARKTKEELLQILTEDFLNVQHIRSIHDGVDNTETFLVLDRPFIISGNVAHSGILLDPNTKEELGSYEKSELFLKEGIKGKFLDFFTGANANEFGIDTVLINDVPILVSNYKVAIRAKLGYGRAKDIWDYQRLIVNDTKESISKVVDENGEPLIVYHNSPNKFDTFNPSLAQTENSIYFTRSKEISESNRYGENAYSVFLNIKNLYDTREANFEHMKQANGVFDPHHRGSYIVHNPNQIKSIYNEGEFSESANIYHEPSYRSNSTSSKDYRLVELFENSEDQREVSKLVEISLVLNLLKENPEYNPVYNLLAKRHQEGRPSLLNGVKVVLESPIRAMYPSYFEKKYKGSRAYYDAKTKTIYINIDKGFNGKADATIWHELMHAMTVERLQDLTLLVTFNLILNKYLEAYPEYKTLYSGENGIEEFVADIWSDQGTIERLKSIKSDNVEKSLWDKIKEFVLSFFEISEKDTLFAEASIALDKLLDLKTFGRVKRLFFEPTSRNAQLWARSVADPTLGYEVSTQGDARFSALNAKFKIGTYIDGVNVTEKTIEEVYQTVIKKSSKGKAPDKTSKLYNPELKTKEEQEDFSYEIGYLPLWQEWARLNPELIQELRQKAKGKILTDKFANTRVSQARALAQIINEMDAKDNPTYSSKVESAKEYWSRESVEKDPTSLYLFTDNTDRTSGTNPIDPTSKYAQLYSEGRQLFYPGKTSAVIRGLDNAMPISTQKSYITARGATGNWTDDNLDIFTEVIEKELQAILKEWTTGKYERIVIPAGGLLGGRIANITLERTPLLYDRFYALMHKYGLDNIIPSNHESKVDIALKNAVEQRFVITGNADFVKGKVVELKARGIKAINTLRTQDNFHYGNPFTPLIVNGTIHKANIKESVEAFEQWIRKEAYLDIEPIRRDEILRQIEAGELDDAVLVYYTEYVPDKSYGEKFYDPIKAPNHAHILLRLIEESKIKRAEKNSSFLLKVEPKKKDERKDLEVQLEQDIQDLLDLIEYLSKKQGLSSEEIKEKQRLFLNEDISAINFVESLLNKVYIRQSELHTLGFDYNEESRDAKGHFNWAYYLNDIDLNVAITEDNVYKKDKTTGKFILNPDGSYNSMFAVLEDYQVDPAEIIMPKLYKSLFKLGNYSLNEITEEFFLKSNPYYQSDLKRINEDGIITDKGKIDFLIRCHNYKFNIAVVDDITKAPAEGLRLVKTEVGESIDRGYRLNSNGDRMYKVPENDSEYKIYKDSYGNETIVFSKENAEKNINALISSLEKLDLVSIQAFLENLEPTKEWINYVINKNNIETNNSKLIALNRNINNLTEDQIKQELQNIYILDLIRYKKDLASVYYNSFIKTLQAISVRIPTQAFLSIMAVKVVGLTNDSSNNVFVNRWQFWLQGSDLDIDKTYIMGADISSIGKYNHWSPIANFTTKIMADLSDELPVPNRKYITTPENYHKASEDSIPVLIKEVLKDPNKYDRIEDLLLKYDQTFNPIITADGLINIARLIGIKSLRFSEDEEKIAQTVRLKIEVELLKYLKNTKELLLTHVATQRHSLNTLISKLNKHNSHKVTAEEARNIILRTIIKTSLDERNMRAGYSPIDIAMDYFKDELNKLKDVASMERDLDDGGLSIARMLYNNSVGKQDVGIMANGLKAFFALTQYLNKMRKDPEFVKSHGYFLGRFNIGRNSGDDYFSTISDIQFERQAILILNNLLHRYVEDLPSNKEINLADHDASLLISSLISLATDNAKELALAKMNASIDLACMHLFLVVLGYRADEIVRFTTGKEFIELSKRMSSSKFSNSSTSVRKELTAMKEKAKTDEDRYRVEMILHIYDSAKEMSKIAKLGGINQGTKVDEIEANDFYNSFANVIEEQISTFQYRVGFYYIKINDDGEIYFADDTGKISVEDGLLTLIGVTTNLTGKLISQLLFLDKKAKLDELNRINKNRKFFTDSFTIDLLRYFNDPEYRDFCVKVYDFVKSNFNVLACMNALPHFYEMLHAFVESEETIKQLGSRSRAVLSNARKAYGKNAKIDIVRVKLIIHSDPEGGPEDFSEELRVMFDEVYYNKSIERKASKFYDDYILSEYLIENKDALAIEYTPSGTSTLEIDLSTNEGILNFCKLMAYTILPTLKEMYPNNTFLSYIRPDFTGLKKKTKDLYLPKYSFLFDVNDLNSVADLNKAFYINDGFVKLDEVKGEGKHLLLKDVFKHLGVDIKVGGNLSICELIYLYDKIVSSSVFSPGSLSRAFETYLSKASKNDPTIGQIAKGIGLVTLEHDLRIRLDINFDSVAFTAFCYQSLIRGTQEGVMRYNAPKKRKGLLDLSKAKEFSIKNVYLFNLKEAKERSQHLKLSEDLLKGISSDRILSNIIETEEGLVLRLSSIVDPEFVYELPYQYSELSVSEIVKALLLFKLTGTDLNEKTFDSFIEKLPKVVNYDSKGAKLKAYQGVSVLKKFVDRMSQLGVEVRTFKDNSEQYGYIKVIAEQKGDNIRPVIHINENADITTTPIHELMHLVFGVMKYENFDAWEKVMSIMMKSENARKILSNLQVAGNPDYINLMDLDQKEEVLCRVLEEICKDNNFEFKDETGQDLLDSIQEIINPYISKTLGINPPKGLINFLKNTVAGLPEYESTLFMKPQHDSTGYIDKQIEIVRSLHITGYIESLLSGSNPKLIATQC